jgi:hypothetical protein
MPRVYVAPAKEGRKLQFWIRSSRGTDSASIITVPSDWKDEEIQSELEDWCEGFGAWQSSDNYVRYGWREAVDGCTCHKTDANSCGREKSCPKVVFPTPKFDPCTCQCHQEKL